MSLKLVSLTALVAVLATAVSFNSGTNGRSVTAQLAAIARPENPQRSTCGVHCGTERWTVKTLTDADHGRVNFQPKKTTVSWLISQDPPNDLAENNRIPAVETQTYRVEAALFGFKLEKDQDFHIVLTDPQVPEQTMIVEIPDPNCEGVCASSHLDDIRKARQDFIDHCGQPTTGFKTLHQRLTVSVTGVGFFDFLHGQKGVADNGIELHPVLQIDFPTDTNECEIFARRTHAH